MTDYLYSTDFQHGSSHQREERIYTDDMDSEKITCQASGEQVIYVGNTLYHMTENEISLNISTGNSYTEYCHKYWKFKGVVFMAQV